MVNMAKLYQQTCLIMLLNFDKLY